MNYREALIQRVRDGYRAAFSEEPRAIYAAPGRVNLIGEHIDYNEGLVLPCAIDRETMIAIGPGEGDKIEAVALDFDAKRDRFSTGKPIKPTEDEWANHLRGVAYFLQEAGVVLPAAKLAIAGNVPIGAGLSSSASLGVVCGLALSSMAGSPQSPETLARIAQKAENVFVGTQCGIMDQMASACAREGHALLLDCQDLSYRHIPVPEGLSLVIIDSGIRRELANSEFNTRRRECEQAAAHYGVASLRDLSHDVLEAGREGLDERIFARARHVVTEIARVEPAAEAIAKGDLPAINRLMRLSHISLHRDFEVTTPETDLLQRVIDTSLATGDRYLGGVRVTGGGFGGCVVALVKTSHASRVVDAVEGRYNRDAAIPAHAEVYAIDSGARRIA